MTELPDLSGVNIILVKPEAGVGTKECYELSDENPALFDEDAYREQMNAVFTDEEKLPVERIAQAAPFLVNDLQEPAVHLAPVIAELIDAVKNTGAVFSAMTGSGSCVFGIYEDESAAGEAQATLLNDPRTSGCKIVPSVLI